MSEHFWKMSSWLSYTSKDKNAFTAYFKPPKPKKRARGRPKGSKSKKTWGGERAKKIKTSSKTSSEPSLAGENAAQSHLNQRGEVVDLTEEDKRVQDARPKATIKETRINWDEPKNAKYMHRCVLSWLQKNDLCSGPKESMRKFCRR